MLKKLLFAVVVCVSLSACETMGGAGTDKFSSAALKENIKIGVSTPQDIRAIYGVPDYTDDDSTGPRYWAYDVDDAKNSIIGSAASFIPLAGISTATNQMPRDRTLSIFFENNRVTNYSLSESRR